MIITDFCVKGYKNIDSIKLSPDKRLNIFCGENAQGKTNLMEALWLCTGCRSFRGSRDKEIIGFNREKAEITLYFKDRERMQKISFAVVKENPKEKRVEMNGVRLTQMSKLFGALKCVVFTPDDPEIAKGAPDKRRSFLDLAISQIKKGYLSAITKYDILLTQRNALLKEIMNGSEKEEALDVWDEQICVAGSYIALLRDTYVKKMNSFAAPMYERLSREKEKLSLVYKSSIFEEIGGKSDYKGELAEKYLSRLKNSRRDDIRLGYTQLGAHRDDIEIEINGLSCREFASQGQARSAALVMKISQAQIILDETGDAPVILLDDVLSELDLPRQSFILREIDSMQFFVTCCDAAAVLRHKMGLIAYISNGSVVEEMRYN